ncbi:MAG: hypothetical protein Kow0047_34120 [Anaerolineae bacterium]
MLRQNPLGRPLELVLAGWKAYPAVRDEATEDTLSRGISLSKRADAGIFSPPSTPLRGHPEAC